MPDIIDDASDLEALNTSIAIRNRPLPIPVSPICINGDCGEPSINGTSYCSKECCEDHAKIIRAQRHSWRV